MKQSDYIDGIYVGPVECWKTFGIAIVRQTIVDWRYAVLQLAHPEGQSRKLLKLKNSCEAFLKSPKCEWYSGLDGKTILRKLKAGEI